MPCLKTQRHEDVLEPIRRLPLQKLGREIDGERPVEAEEALDESLAAHGRHNADEFFNLMGRQHRCLSTGEPARTPDIVPQLNNILQASADVR